MPLVFPHLDPTIAVALLWVAGGLLVLALGLWLGGIRESDRSQGPSITGNNNLQAGRDIHVGADPVEVARHIRRQQLEAQLESERAIDRIISEGRDRERAREKMRRIAEGEE